MLHNFDPDKSDQCSKSYGGNKGCGNLFNSGEQKRSGRKKKKIAC